MPRRSLTMPSGKRKLKRVGVSSVKNIYGKGRARLCRAFSFSALQRRRYVLFSVKRKVPKDLPRRCLGLSFCYWEVHIHGSKGVAVLARLAQATNINWEAIYTLLKHSAKINRITMQCFALQGNAVREVCATGKSAPQAQGARRVSALRYDVTERGGG